MGMTHSPHGRDEKCLRNFGWKTWREEKSRRSRRGWGDNIR